MPYPGLIYRVLIASPADCAEERKVIPDVLYLWNSLNARRVGAVLEPVMWETHARPALGDRPQAIINKQLVVSADILVATFWTRLGTHTGAAPSGTAEEIDEFRRAGKPVLLYFCDAPVIMSVDPEQHARLREYRRAIASAGLFSTYIGVNELRELVLRHISGAMDELHRSP